MKKFIEQTLICSVFSTLVSIPTAFAVPATFTDSIDVTIGQSQRVNKTSEQCISYHTVKDYESLRSAIEDAKSGDVIIYVGDYNIRDSYKNLTIRNKELTIVSGNCSRRIDIGSITIENGTLNLGMPGTKSPSELHTYSKFVLNNATLNLYDGAYIDYFNNSDWHLIDAKNTESKINLYGGSIQNNTVGSLIINGKELSLTICGTAITKNKVTRELATVKSFIMKSGSIADNTKCYWRNLVPTTDNCILVADNAILSGGTLVDDLSCNSARISGGTFKTVTAKSVYISGKATIDKLVADKITVDDKLDENSKITIHYDNYKINNKQKVVNVSNGIEVRDVFNIFKISNSNYFVNNKGYLDDTPSYKYEITDNSTGIKIESDESITLCDVDSTTAPNVSTFTICQPNDTEKDSVNNLSFYVNGKLAKSSDINKVAIYVPYTASKLDLNKLNSVKIYDSNNEEMIGCKKTVKSINGKLYTLITIDNK